MTDLEHVYVEGAADAPVLLLLHGTGGGPNDLVGIARELNPDAALLAPAGQVSEHGMSRWFRRMGEGNFDFDDVRRRAGDLADFVVAAREKYGLTGRRLVAVGFSNGANIAGALVLLHPDVLTESIQFATMTPVPDPPEHDLSGSRVFISNGEQDPMAPLPSAKNFMADLRKRGADVTVHWHPGGHGITPEGLAAAKTWLDAK